MLKGHILLTIFIDNFTSVTDVLFDLHIKRFTPSYLVTGWLNRLYFSYQLLIVVHLFSDRVFEFHRCLGCGEGPP